MEEADVKQLISLIESAQLQYEVDDSGTVSIVCDPVQLVESTNIDNTQDSLINEGSLLTHQNEAPISSGEVSESKTHGTDISTCEQDGRKYDKVFQEQKIKVEQEEEIDIQSNDTSLIRETPETSSPVHYFLQTSNGEIIQVFETLNDVNEESTEGTAQILEGISSGGNFNGNLGSRDDEDIQIFVVGDCNGGDMFLINTPERHLTEENGDPLDASQTLFKGQGTVNSINEHTNKEPEERAPLAADDVNKDPNIFLNVALMEDNSSISKPPDVSSKISRPVVRTILHRKSSLSSASGKQYVKLLSQTKPRVSLKDSSTVDSLPSTLAEGSVIQTNKGEMMAYSLSSVTKDESSGKRSVLHNIASSFGSWLKVLRPVDQEKEVSSTNVKKRFNIYSCEDCETVLHSERSLKIHRRRFHEEWDDECYICGEKFLNQHYVRSHVREVHSEEKSFECRYCSFRCSLLKEFFKHCRVHKKSQVCGNCGKKYASPKLFQDHMINCSSKPDAKFDYINDVDCEYPMKIPKGLEKKEGCISYQSPIDINSCRKKLGKLDNNNKKRDLEYKIESKHYSQQIKRMALDQSTRSRSKGRYRTHRCYLCFKLFSNNADLDAHKEVYHQVKSSQPVRVKTDDSLGKEEEDTLEVLNTNEFGSCNDGMIEGVQIKSEPPDITESIENVTIVLDEYMNLFQVIKPLCIACKAYTKTDFRESCKLFKNISKFDQSEALKKFEKFFPCVLNHESLIGPWVLCKKCSVLIDKITDMEEKLLSMKTDLISRLQGNEEDSPADAYNKSDDDDKKGEQLFCKLRKDSSSFHPSLNILSDAFDTEKYVRESFEIMEIIQPAKRKRSHNKKGGEKLAPILLSDDDHEDLPPNNGTEFVSNIENMDIDGDKSPQKSVMTIPVNLSSVKKEIADEVIERSHDIRGPSIKTEPLQRELDSVIPETDNSNWKEDEDIPINTEEQLSNDFLLPIAKPKKDDQLDSDLFHHQLLPGDFETSQKKPCKGSTAEEFKGESVSNEVCQKKVLHPLDSEYFPPNSSKILSKTEVKPDEGDCVSQLSNIQKVLKELDEKNEDLNLKGIGHKKDPSNSFETFNEDIEAKEENPKDMSHEPLQKPFMGKKRARIREERNMMSYRLEGDVAKPWVCSNCHKGFSTQRGACDHYAASHGGQSYSCEHCNASYVRKRDLIGHYNRVHLKAKPYKCKKCSESFSMHSQLYRHTHVAHMEEKKTQTHYTCHLCDASFSQKRYRDAHIEACETKGSDITPYTCLLCDKSFKLEKYLGLHMKTCHSVKSDAFFCEICNKVLNDKRNLVLHMKSHSGETKTSCNICHKQFSRKAYLWTHMRVHTNERPYGCNYCPKWFKQYSTWKNHERTHTGEKPYKCSVCNSCFATSSSVSKHLQYAHYNIRDFGCSICKKYFISKAKLEEHMKTHTGEKPFKCPVCGRAFNKKTNLRTHMYIHSTNKRFKCEICGEGFMRRTAIENHILERHNDLELLLASNMSNASKGKANDVTAATSPFISVIGAEDVNSEDTYIVVYADEDKEADNSKDMEVTVLVDDAQYSQVRSTSKQLKLSLGSSQIDRTLSHGNTSGVIVKKEDSIEETETLPSLITTEDDTASLIQSHKTSQATYL